MIVDKIQATHLPIKGGFALVGIAASTCDPSTQESEQEDPEFEIILESWGKILSQNKTYKAKMFPPRENPELYISVEILDF